MFREEPHGRQFEGRPDHIRVAYEPGHRQHLGVVRPHILARHGHGLGHVRTVVVGTRRQPQRERRCEPDRRGPSDPDFRGRPLPMVARGRALDRLEDLRGPVEQRLIARRHSIDHFPRLILSLVSHRVDDSLEVIAGIVVDGDHEGLDLPLEHLVVAQEMGEDVILVVYAHGLVVEVRSPKFRSLKAR